MKYWEHGYQGPIEPAGCRTLPDAFEAVGRKVLGPEWEPAVRTMGSIWRQAAPHNGVAEKRWDVVTVVHRLLMLGGLHACIRYEDGCLIPFSRTFWERGGHDGHKFVDDGYVMYDGAFAAKYLDASPADTLYFAHHAKARPIFITLRSLKYAIDNIEVIRVPESIGRDRTKALMYHLLGEAGLSDSGSVFLSPSKDSPSQPGTVLIEHGAVPPVDALEEPDILEDIDQCSDKSGAGGRPTPIHIYESMMRKRAQRGTLNTGSITAEADELRAIFIAHPKCKGMNPGTAKTIRNRLSGLYRKLMAERPE